MTFFRLFSQKFTKRQQFDRNVKIKFPHFISSKLKKYKIIILKLGQLPVFSAQSMYMITILLTNYSYFMEIKTKEVQYSLKQFIIQCSFHL